MIVGLNIPTTYRIASDLLAQIAAFGFSHVRVDVPPDGDLAAFVDDYCEQPVTPLFLLHDVARNEPLLDRALSVLGPDGFWLQVFNEPPGFDHVDLPTYTQGILAVHHDARARGFIGPILMGGLGNPGASNRMWVTKALESMPADVVVDEHRYAYKTQDDWSRAWPPFTSRESEILDLRRLSSGRDVTWTELGWHTAPEQIGWGPFQRSTQLTDEQATENLVKDLTLGESCGLSAMFVFQLNDGPGESWGDKQGIRRFGGSWKPQAECVKRFRSGG